MPDYELPLQRHSPVPTDHLYKGSPHGMLTLALRRSTERLYSSPTPAIYNTRAFIFG